MGRDEQGEERERAEEGEAAEVGEPGGLEAPDEGEGPVARRDEREHPASGASWRVQASGEQRVRAGAPAAEELRVVCDGRHARADGREPGAAGEDGERAARAVRAAEARLHDVRVGVSWGAPSPTTARAA